MLDSGRFTLYVDGARVGEEEFLIREERGGAVGPIYQASGEQRLKLEGRTMLIAVAIEATGARPRPRRYEAQVNGGSATSVVARVIADRLRLEIRSPTGEEMKEFLVRGRTAILDRYIAHHYFFVGRLLGDQAQTAIEAVAPRTREKTRYRVENRGSETIRIGDREFATRHLVLTPDSGEPRHVWLDGDRVIRVTVPDEGFTAERSDEVSPSPSSSRGTS